MIKDKFFGKPKPRCEVRECENYTVQSRCDDDCDRRYVKKSVDSYNRTKDKIEKDPNYVTLQHMGRKDTTIITGGTSMMSMDTDWDETFSRDRRNRKRGQYW